MKKKAEDSNAYYNKQPAKMNVYDAGESVKDMPVKKTEESHKKCSPGEFGMHKEGNAFAFGRKAANDWMGLSSSRNGPGGLISTKTLPKTDATAKNWGPAGQLPPPSLGTRVAVPGAAQAPQQPAMKQILQKQVPMVPVKAGSALTFGQKIAEAVGMPFTREGYNQIGASSAAGTLGLLGGGALGAAGGAIHGLISPGETVRRDAEGNPVIKKRNRLIGALRGGLAGGAGGAIGGMALGMGGGALTEKLRPGTLEQLFPDLQRALNEQYDRYSDPRWSGWRTDDHTT